MSPCFQWCDDGTADDGAAADASVVSLLSVLVALGVGVPFATSSSQSQSASLPSTLVMSINSTSTAPTSANSSLCLMTETAFLSRLRSNASSSIKVARPPPCQLIIFCFNHIGISSGVGETNGILDAFCFGLEGDAAVALVGDEVPGSGAGCFYFGATLLS